MKKYYTVSFKYSDSVYCTNIAHAESKAKAEAHYSGYSWAEAREATDREVMAAQRKGMPIIEI